MTYKYLKQIFNGVPWGKHIQLVIDWFEGALGQNKPQEYTYQELCNLTKNKKIQVGRKYILKNYTTDLSGVAGWGNRQDAYPDFKPIYYDITLTGKSETEFEEDVDLQFTKRVDNDILLVSVPQDYVVVYGTMRNLETTEEIKVRFKFFIYNRRLTVTGFLYNNVWIDCYYKGPSISNEFISLGLLNIDVSFGGQLFSSDDTIVIHITIPKQTIEVPLDAFVYPIMKGKYKLRDTGLNWDKNAIKQFYPNATILQKSVSYAGGSVDGYLFVENVVLKTPDGTNISAQKVIALFATSPTNVIMGGFKYIRKDDNINEIQFLYVNETTGVVNFSASSAWVKIDTTYAGLLTNIQIPEKGIDIDYDFFNISCDITRMLGSGSGSGSGSDSDYSDYIMTFDMEFGIYTNIQDNIIIKSNSLIPFNYCNTLNGPYDKNIKLINSTFNIIYIYSDLELINSNYNIIGELWAAGAKCFLQDSDHNQIATLNGGEITLINSDANIIGELSENTEDDSDPIRIPIGYFELIDCDNISLIGISYIKMKHSADSELILKENGTIYYNSAVDYIFKTIEFLFDKILDFNFTRSGDETCEINIYNGAKEVLLEDDSMINELVIEETINDDYKKLDINVLKLIKEQNPIE